MGAAQQILSSIGGGAASGITIVDVGAFTSGTTAISPPLPSGTAENDILVLFLETFNEAITVSGWTEAADSPVINTSVQPTRLTIFWKRAGASESAPTTSDSGDHQAGQILGVRGCLASGDPWDDTTSGTQLFGLTVTVPGITTTVANALVIAAVGIQRDGAGAWFSAWTNGNLTGITERMDDICIDGNGGGFGVATGYKATAGATGDMTVTSFSQEVYTLWCGALKPA
jgi:hypothetical protein